MLWRKAVFIVLVIFCLSPLGSPQAAVILGAALGLTLGNPFPQINNKTTELLLEASIVLLAFGTDLPSVYRTFTERALFVAAAVLVFIVLVYFLGRVLGVNRSPVLLARAQNSFAINGEDTQYSKPLPIAIMVSAIGLIVFPLIGRYFHLTSNQFGMWVAMAIPGPTFVAGTAANFKPDVTAMAIPLALTATFLMALVGLITRFGAKDPKQRPPTHFPWFVLIFVLAVAARTYAPVSIFPSIFDAVVNLGNAGIVVGLFFIGATVCRSEIKNASAKQLIQVFLPWLLVSAASFWTVLHLYPG